jgi:hypothetical protein
LIDGKHVLSFVRNRINVCRFRYLPNKVSFETSAFKDVPILEEKVIRVTLSSRLSSPNVFEDLEILMLAVFFLKGGKFASN